MPAEMLRWMFEKKKDFFHFILLALPVAEVHDLGATDFGRNCGSHFL